MSEGPERALIPDAALARLGRSLPAPVRPPARFAAAASVGGVMYVSGQLPFDYRGALIATGRLGKQLDVDAGRRCAEACALQMLAQIQEEIGSLECVARMLRSAVHVASAPGFGEQHLVADGASELLQAVLGSRGEHARSTLGVASLPFDSPVELDAIVSYDMSRRCP